MIRSRKISAADDRIESHVWLISSVVILGMAMSILDTTIVNVALATLGRELHSTISQIQWVVTGYMLALAAVIPLSGWAAERRSAHSSRSCGPAGTSWSGRWAGSRT